MKRKSDLGEQIFEVKSSIIHTTDIDQSGTSGFGGLIVRRLKENYIFQGFGEIDPYIAEMFRNI